MRKYSSKHIICTRCSEEADMELPTAIPLCRRHAEGAMEKKASEDPGGKTLRELADTGDIHDANGRPRIRAAG